MKIEEITDLTLLYHGKEMLCPTCNYQGHFDLMVKGVSYHNAIWYNQYTDQFECWNCWLK